MANQTVNVYPTTKGAAELYANNASQESQLVANPRGDLLVAQSLPPLAVLQFTSFRDANLCQIAEVSSIGRGYNLPSGKMWAQAQARGALNIAADNKPAFSITILPD